MGGGDTCKKDSRLLFNRLVPTYDAAGCFAHFGRLLVEAAGPRPGQRVLDVETGRGAMIFPSAERVEPTGEVIGIDLAEEIVRAANDDAERRGGGPRAHGMDAEQLRFPDTVFDRVLCAFGLMLLPDQLGALREFHRVLRPGGRVGLSTWQVSESEALIAVLAQWGWRSCRWDGSLKRMSWRTS